MRSGSASTRAFIRASTARASLAAAAIRKQSTVGWLCRDLVMENEASIGIDDGLCVIGWTPWVHCRFPWAGHRPRLRPACCVLRRQARKRYGRARLAALKRLERRSRRAWRLVGFGIVALRALLSDAGYFSHGPKIFGYITPLRRRDTMFALELKKACAPRCWKR